MFLIRKLGNVGKYCLPDFFKVTKTNAYILYALSRVEGTTKAFLQKLKKTLVDELIDHPIDTMLPWKV